MALPEPPNVSTPTYITDEERNDEHKARRQATRTVRAAIKLLGAVAATSLVAGISLGASLFIPSAETVEADKQMLATTMELSETLATAEAEATPATDTNPTEPPAAAVHPTGDQYALIHIPRLGDAWQRPIASGGDAATIDRVMDANYVAHFAQTQGLGEEGNYSLIGHREGVFGSFATVKAGDLIYIKSEQGFYTYEVDVDPYLITPEQVEVLNPTPMTDEPATERKLTLITCYPDWGNSHRRIVEASLTNWQPLSAGAPDGITL